MEKGAHELEVGRTLRGGPHACGGAHLCRGRTKPRWGGAPLKRALHARKGALSKGGASTRLARQKQGKGRTYPRGAQIPRRTPKPSSSGVGYCIRFFLCISLLLYLLEISIIKFLFCWFSPWGFFQGHVDQKYLCINLVVCIFPYQH
jgi:hypothetical protein